MWVIDYNVVNVEFVGRNGTYLTVFSNIYYKRQIISFEISELISFSYARVSGILGLEFNEKLFNALFYKVYYR